MNKQELKNVLSISIDKCILKLTEIIPKEDKYYNDLIILKKQYSDIKSDNMKGKISFENWTTTNNQISDRILVLIDNVFGVQKENKEVVQTSKEIAKAINWLSTEMVGVGYEYLTKERYQDRAVMNTLHSKSISKCRINDDGSIEFEVKTKFRRRDYLEKDNSLYVCTNIDMESINSGNLRDIESVELKECKNKNEGYLIIASAAEGEMLFHERWKSINKSWDRTGQKSDLGKNKYLPDDDKFLFESIEEEKSATNYDYFVFNINNLGLAKRIKSCLEYLSIFFKDNNNEF